MSIVRANPVAAWLFILAAAPVHASIITNGSFETATANNVPDGWTLTGNVARIGTFNPDGSFGFPFDGSFALVFSSGNLAHNGVVTQLLTTNAGSTYEISFGIRQRGRNALVSPMRLFASAIDINDSSVLGAVTAEDFRINGVSTPESSPYLVYTFQFTATGTQTLLQFQDDPTLPAGDNADLLLDRVQGQNLSEYSVVPEPSSITICGLGALCLVGFLRRKRAIAAIAAH